MKKTILVFLFSLKILSLITSCNKQVVAQAQLTDTLGKSITLWGLTENGGTKDSGTIFKVNGDGSNYQIVFSFDNTSGVSPWGKLCRSKNGKLYGKTTGGGKYNSGTIFSFDPTNNKFTNLFDFNHFVSGSGNLSVFSDLVETNNGKIYGSSERAIFYIDPATDAISFIQNNYSLNSNTTVSSFSTMTTISGSNTIYGTAILHNSKDAVNTLIIFKLDTQTNLFSIEHSVGSYNISLSKSLDLVGSMYFADDGNLYGILNNNLSWPLRYASILKYSPQAKSHTVIKDFINTNNAYPTFPTFRNKLIQIKESLYGSIYTGGENARGIFFRYDIKSGIVKNISDYPNLINQNSGYFGFGNPTGICDIARRNLIYILGYGGMLDYNIHPQTSILRYNISDSSSKLIFTFPDKKNSIVSFGDVIE